MIHHRCVRNLSAFLILMLFVTSFGVFARQAPVAQAQAVQNQPTSTTLPDFSESEPNDSLTPTNQSNSIGLVGSQTAWQQTITGRIGYADDLDWYTFSVGPATTVTVTLTNLPGDYDLALASDSNGLPETDSGLDEVVDLGGGITAIGGGITAIGGGITAIGGGITAISVQSGSTPERIETFLWQPGTYYLAVASNNGDFSDLPYTLNIRVNGSDLNEPPPAPEVQIKDSVNGTVDTLYIISPSRMRQQYPDESTAITQIESFVDSFASSIPGNGYVINLDDLLPIVQGQPSLTDIYDSWDANRSNPLYANGIAKLIDNVITAATIRNPSGPSPTMSLGEGGTSIEVPPFPNVEHIVLVGGDAVIPFLRVPDLTTIANEADYAAYLQTLDARGIIDPNSPQGAALRYRALLTDNVYGNDKPYRFHGYPLFVPNRGVGRLVETPQEILNYLSPYGYQDQSFTIGNDSGATQRAFVTGYDFLIDQAEAVSTTLRDMGYTNPISVAGLINNAWTSTDLGDDWFDGNLATFTDDYDFEQSPFDLQSINAHFDHWQIIPASEDNGTFVAQRILTPTANYSEEVSYFTNRLGYSVGCHSGLNVDDRMLELTDNNREGLYGADFPQAFIKQGGNWIGNTGYGYGSLDTVGYSEQLALLLTQELGRDVHGDDNVYVGAAIGTALAKAKQRYLREATSLEVYDAKALMVMTLYGLPFIRVQVPSPTPVPSDDRPITRDNALAPLSPPSDGLGTLERVITFTIGVTNTTIGRTNSQYPELTNVGAEDSFVLQDFSTTPQPRIVTASKAGLPVLPQFAYDLTALSKLSDTQRLKVRDVTFVGGTYGAEGNYNPQITQVVTETFDLLSQTTIEPTFEAGAGVWYPAKFFGVTSVGSENDRRDQLVVTAAQFKATSDGRTGVMRPYTTMIFKVSYVDPGADRASEALADETPPQIKSVRILPPTGNALQADGASVVVEVSDELDGTDSTGIDKVEAVYAVQTGTGEEWIPVTFTRVSSTRWIADVPKAFNELRLIVSATDASGNTAFYTAKGRFTDTQTVFLPIVQR